MKRYGLLILIVATVAAGCAPHYTSGKTQCSDKKECPDGFSCSDDGTSGIHYCVDNKTVGCSSGSTFYCSQTRTCWAKPGVCSSVVNCGTAQAPDWSMCLSPGYHPDCSGDKCLPNGSVPDAGTSKGGSTGTLGAGGAAGATGPRDGGGTGGVTTGVKDAGVLLGTGGLGIGGVVGSGGVRDAGIVGSGGSAPPVTLRDAGVVGMGGAVALGGAVGRGGTTGTAGAGGFSTCSGTPNTCDMRISQSECQWGMGCTWNTTTLVCSGTALACSVYTTSTMCIVNGCAWAGPLTCSKTPITSNCSTLLGSSTDPCEVCMFNSCCGQITNCTNDSACNTSMSGTLWNAYMDCAANCCATSCEF
jgi:hypothetical protein